MGLLASQSTVKTFRRCRKQYQYKVIEGLEPRFPHERLKLGNWWHDLARAYYSGEDWEKEHKSLTKKFNKLFLEEREKYGDLPDKARRLFLGYLNRYNKDDKDWEILYVEETFEVNINGHTVSFKPDLIVREGKGKRSKIWVVDHKTTKSIPDAEYRLVDLQSAIYVWALEMADVCKPTGFVWNYVRTKEPTIPSINIDGAISRRRIDTDFYTLASFLRDYYQVETLRELPKEWKTQLQALKTSPSKFYKRARVAKSAKDPLVQQSVREFFVSVEEMDALNESMREGLIDIEDPFFTRTQIYSCSWDCDFADICMGELLGNDMTHLRKTKFQGSKYMKERG